MLNEPIPDDYQAKIETVGISTWIVCPYCGKKQFKITPGAIIQGQFFECQNQKCKNAYEVNTE